MDQRQFGGCGGKLSLGLSRAQAERSLTQAMMSVLPGFVPGGTKRCRPIWRLLPWREGGMTSNLPPAVDRIGRMSGVSGCCPAFWAVKITRSPQTGTVNSLPSFSSKGNRDGIIGTSYEAGASEITCAWECTWYLNSVNGYWRKNCW